jgi:hypothetical protein
VAFGSLSQVSIRSLPENVVLALHPQRALLLANVDADAWLSAMSGGFACLAMRLGTTRR